MNVALGCASGLAAGPTMWPFPTGAALVTADPLPGPPPAGWQAGKCLLTVSARKLSILCQPQTGYSPMCEPTLAGPAPDRTLMFQDSKLPGAEGRCRRGANRGP